MQIKFFVKLKLIGDEKLSKQRRKTKINLKKQNSKICVPVVRVYHLMAWDRARKKTRRMTQSSKRSWL